ncbi:hypothetical protein EBZ39_15375 [bacterium]|nr:hypothetical protein [bacterium]
MSERQLRPDEETEAAIWAEGTQYTKADIMRAYRTHLAGQPEPLDIQSFCRLVLGIEDATPNKEVM